MRLRLIRWDWVGSVLNSSPPGRSPLRRRAYFSIAVWGDQRGSAHRSRKTYERVASHATALSLSASARAGVGRRLLRCHEGGGIRRASPRPLPSILRRLIDFAGPADYHCPVTGGAAAKREFSANEAACLTCTGRGTFVSSPPLKRFERKAGYYA